MLSRDAVERVEEQKFVGKRRILQSDHLFRDELSARLSQLASKPGLPSDELTRLAQTLKRSIHDEAAWYDTIHLDDAQTGLLAQYDDLVWEQVYTSKSAPLSGTVANTVCIHGTYRTTSCTTTSSRTLPSRARFAKNARPSTDPRSIRIANT